MSTENHILAKLRAILAGSSELDAYGCIRIAPIIVRESAQRIEELEAENAALRAAGEGQRKIVEAARAANDLYNQAVGDAGGKMAHWVEEHWEAVMNLYATIDAYSEREKGALTDGEQTQT